MAGTPRPDDLSTHTSQVVTADGVIGTSGASSLVFAITLMAGSDTATAAIYDGTSTGGTLRENLSMTAGLTVSTYYGEQGVDYAGGIYINISGTDSSVTVVYNQ